MDFSKPKGTYDVLPDESAKWQFVESIAREVASVYNVFEIRTPIFESSELYHRSAGETSDVVSKETYDFVDRGGRGLTLRPEGTAGAVRSFIENKLYIKTGTQKMFYIGPMFRYERQQKGRYRQHIQFGVEFFGSASPLTDVEVISMAVLMIEKLGLASDVKVKLNSLGSDESRELYRGALVKHFTSHKEGLCSDCQVRFDKNPLRILDCKKDASSDAMASAPEMIHHLTPDDLDYFNQVKAGLDAVGIRYEYDRNLVRGFDYYTHTIFEVQADIPGFGSQTTLCGGGRYDKLVEELGGPATPAVGFGMGLERILLALDAANINHDLAKEIDVYFLPMGLTAELETTKIINNLRENGIMCEADYSNRKLKARFKLVDDANARFVIVIGDTEVESRNLTLKDAKTGEINTVTTENLVEFFNQM